MPFTYLRAYASELCTTRRAGGPGARIGRDGPSSADRPEAGACRLPAVTPRNAVDVEIDRQARCRDQRGSLTHLFFSDDLIELARARAICSICTVRTACLARALEREEPYGVWGGEMLIDGACGREAAAGPAAAGEPPAASSSTRSPASRYSHGALPPCTPEERGIGRRRRCDVNRASAEPRLLTYRLCRGWPIGRRSCPRLHACARRAALHADARRPRRRRHQGGAAGR